MTGNRFIRTVFGVIFFGLMVHTGCHRKALPPPATNASTPAAKIEFILPDKDTTNTNNIEIETSGRLLSGIYFLSNGKGMEHTDNPHSRISVSHDVINDNEYMSVEISNEKEPNKIVVAHIRRLVSDCEEYSILIQSSYLIEIAFENATNLELVNTNSNERYKEPYIMNPGDYTLVLKSRCETPDTNDDQQPPQKSKQSNNTDK